MSHSENASKLWRTRKTLGWLTLAQIILAVAGVVEHDYKFAAYCGGLTIITALTRAVVGWMFHWSFNRATASGLSRNYVNHSSSSWSQKDYDQMGTYIRNHM
jgi:hypothetical protein